MMLSFTSILCDLNFIICVVESMRLQNVLKSLSNIGDYGAMLIVVANRHNDPSSNPRRGALNFA